MKLIVLALAAGTAVAECPNVSSSVATKAGQRKAAARERPARGSPRHLNTQRAPRAPTETHTPAPRGPPSATTQTRAPGTRERRPEKTAGVLGPRLLRRFR